MRPQLVVVDGHNAAFGLALGGKGEAGRRKALLDHVRRSRLAEDRELWIVFDSRRGEDAWSHRLDPEDPSVRVWFADGTFDDWVVERAENGEFPGDTLVVTDDYDLRLRLSGRVVCAGVSEFFKRAPRERGRRD